MVVKTKSAHFACQKLEFCMFTFAFILLTCTPMLFRIIRPCKVTLMSTNLCTVKVSSRSRLLVSYRLSGPGAQNIMNKKSQTVKTIKCLYHTKLSSVYRSHHWSIVNAATNLNMWLQSKVLTDLFRGTGPAPRGSHCLRGWSRNVTSVSLNPAVLFPHKRYSFTDPWGMDRWASQEPATRETITSNKGQWFRCQTC